MQVIVSQGEDGRMFWACLFFSTVLLMLVSLVVSMIMRFFLCELEEFVYERVLNSCCDV
jgi:hypothetical protein